MIDTVILVILTKAKPIHHANSPYFCTMDGIGHSRLWNLSGKSGKSRRRQGGLTWLLLILLCTCVRAQKSEIHPNDRPDTAIYEYPIRTITVRDGLTRNQLYRVWEDKRGFVWLAGKRGLDRFDGLEVVSFQSDSTVGSDNIRQITEDREGTLWFFANDAMYRYDGTRFQGETAPANTKSNSPPFFEGRPLLYRREGDNMFVLQKQSSLDTLVKFRSTVDKNRILRYTFTHSDNGLYSSTWSSGPDTLSHLSFDTFGSKKTIRIADDIYPLTPMLSTEPQRVIINDSLFAIRSNTLIFERTTAPYWKEPRYLWDSPSGPIFRSEKVIQLPDAPFPQLYRSKDFTHAMHYRKDHLFIAAEEGLIIVDPESPVLLFPTGRGMASDVWSMLEGEVAGAKDVGGAKFFLPFNSGSIIKLENSRYQRMPSSIKSKSYHYPGATRSEDGTFLIPTTYKIFRFDPVTERFTPLDIMNRRATNDILETGNRIYAATRGLAVYENDQLLKIFADDDGLDVENFGFFESINEDRDGRLWLGSHKGLAVRETDGSFRNYLEKKEIPAGIVHSTTDLRGNLWFATHDGIALHDYTDTLPRWVTPDFHEDTKFVHIIDSTWLLIGGTSKLYLLDLPKFYVGEVDIYPFDEDDGFPVVEPLQASVMEDSKGIIWIGTTDGVVRLDPAKIRLHKEPTEPHFHSFGWLDESGENARTTVIPFNDNGAQSFTVKSTDQNIDIRFFTINHDKPHAMRFRHRLVGYRDTWTPPSPVRTVSYGELPPGDYRFELQACLYGKCTETKTLDLRVAPARFLEYLITKLLFSGLLLVLLGTLGYQLFVRRKEQERAAHQKRAFELERAEARRKLTVHKVGPHFANNALTAITDLIIREENEAARRYTSHFAELFKPVLEDSLGLLWTLSEELSFIDAYLELETLRFGEKLDATIRIAAELEEMADDILVPPLLVQSFVNNAIKHGVEPVKRGRVVIKAGISGPDYLEVTITDNGPGLNDVDSAEEGTGINAARVMLQYLNQYTGTRSEFHFEQPEIGGTSVTIRLYLHHQLID